MELETTGGDRSSEVWEKAGIPDDLRPLNPELISQGAEARVYKATFLGRPTIVKERFTKAYRLPELDVKLNQSRITQEARCLVKGRAAGAVKHFLFARGTQSPEALELGAQIGQTLGCLHNAGVIHGDLTSNMMIKEDGSLVMIDFGLSYITRNHVEDAAVDLYVLERVFTSTHPSSQELFVCIIEEYRKSANKSKTVLPRLEEGGQNKRRKKRETWFGLGSAKAQGMKGVPERLVPQSLPPGLNVTGPPYFGTFNRPARQQADEVEKWDTDATDYNIWYNKKCGDYRSKRIDGRENAAHRCQILKDAGITRSDENSYICVYFARGKCVRGADCTFHHRIPDERDDARLDITYDVFGRERHRTDRDDMGGVGTFSRDNRTLYIGGVRRVKGVDLQELIVRNFIEFGELESVRVIWDKSIAFVRYKLRAASEFAKEAMADQSLGYKEVLNVRWANEDPNPRSQREKAFAVANQAYNAVMAHGGPAPYPDMSTLGTGDAYPTTDGQYSEAAVPAEYQQALQYASTYYPGTTHQPPYDPAAGGVPQEESALSLLSAYDVDSYADRYGSSTDDQQPPPAGEAAEQQASGVVSATTVQDQQQVQADYTSDQWRQWYMYYYGYVPAELPSAGGAETATVATSGGTPAPATPASGPAIHPQPSGVGVGVLATPPGTAATDHQEDAPAKKLRTQ